MTHLLLPGFSGRSGVPGDSWISGSKGTFSAFCGFNHKNRYLLCVVRRSHCFHLSISKGRQRPLWKRWTSRTTGPAGMQMEEALTHHAPLFTTMTFKTPGLLLNQKLVTSKINHACLTWEIIKSLCS